MSYKTQAIFKLYQMRLITVLFIFLSLSINGQNLNDLIPDQTATHVAQSSGSWFDANIWDTGTVPSNGAIVLIPIGITVTYDGFSNSHIFVIKVNGQLEINAISGGDSKLVVDTFIGTISSFIKIKANNPSDGSIDIVFDPFDIESFKASPEGQLWNVSAQSFYSDDEDVSKYKREITGKYRYDTYQEAIEGDMAILSTFVSMVDDGPGVLGRYLWDPEQLSLGMLVMGEIEIIGKEKKTKIKLSTDALRGQKEIQLSTPPTGWEIGDTIIVTLGGNFDTPNNGNDEAVIASINGTTINTVKKLKKNHIGRPQDTLHCYVGNLMRNITLRSKHVETSLRSHFMAMHNDSNIQIKNAAFRHMGRTDKTKVLDDFIWDHWVEPKVDHCKISALGQEIAVALKNPPNEITNPRGRYSIHLHRLGSDTSTNMAHVTGNAVWGNNGWAITQHHSYATIADNVVYDVTGAGIVSESGSELGFWDNNLVVKVDKGQDLDVYQGVVAFDDFLFSGQALGMKGRGVICRNNVIADATQAVGIMNMNPLLTNTDRVDPLALATFRPDFEIDQFPLDINEYSAEGNGVLPVEISLLLYNTTMIYCRQGLRSVERDMGVNHESRSLFDGFKVWGADQGLSITYQTDYTFRDVFISGKNQNKSLGMYLWKHSHNHVFDNVKLADLKYGVTVSKLVESGNGELKTRNNGFTQWFFLDLVTENLDKFYQITKDDPTTTTLYDEHGDNPIHLPTSAFSERPTTFTILDSTDMYVDIASSKLRFTVDGIIADRLSSYHMGVKQAPAQGTLRLDYPERVYQFASVTKLEEYITENGLFEHPVTGELYFIINELLPDRFTANYTSFPMRIRVDNPPSGGVWSSPTFEPEENFLPQNNIVSRLASVSQSSTKQGITYKDSIIDCSAFKAIDGSTNGRINVNYLQRGLVPIGSFSQTNTEQEPWYDLDLGERTIIDYIDIWNTVELNGYEIEESSDHFIDFYVLISDQPFGNMSLSDAISQSTYVAQKDASTTRLFSLGELDVEGQYVRIQAPGNTMIKHAEVEIIGRKAEKKCTIVTNTNDSGSGSLREAIECAMPGDTITFSESINDGVIVISTTPITIDKELTIFSDASQNITVSSVTPQTASLPCVFIIDSGNDRVDMIGYEIIGGFGPDGSVIKNNGSLLLDNMTLTNDGLTNINSTVLNMLNASLTIRDLVELRH